MGTKGVPVSEEKIKIIIDAKKEGTGTDEIAQTLGVSLYTVSKYWRLYKEEKL